MNICVDKKNWHRRFAYLIVLMCSTTLPLAQNISAADTPDKNPVLLNAISTLDTATLGYGELYSNEYYDSTFKPVLRRISSKQGYLGVGTFQNYNFMVWQQPSWAGLFDATAQVPFLHLFCRIIYLEQPTPQGFFNLISGTTDAEKTALRQTISRYYSGIVEKGVLAYYEEHVIGDNFKSRKLIANLKEEFKEDRFLSSQKNYDVIRNMYINNQIQIYYGYNNDIRFFKKLLLHAESENVTIGAYYMSNSNQYIENNMHGFSAVLKSLSNHNQDLKILGTQDLRRTPLNFTLSEVLSAKAEYLTGTTEEKKIAEENMIRSMFKSDWGPSFVEYDSGATGFWVYNSISVSDFATYFEKAMKTFYGPAGKFKRSCALISAVSVYYGRAAIGKYRQ